MRYLVLAAGLVACATLAACVTQTPPVAMGSDTYMIGTHARGGFRSNSALLTETIQRANAHCAAMGRIAEVRQTTATGTQGWTPQDANVVFRCVEGPAVTP